MSRAGPPPGLDPTLPIGSPDWETAGAWRGCSAEAEPVEMTPFTLLSESDPYRGTLGAAGGDSGIY